MRQRVTYLVPQGTDFGRDDLTFNKTHFDFASASDVVEECRTTFGLSELPLELQIVFEELHELHLRIVAAQNFHSFNPVVSRLSPGFHAFITPQSTSGGTNLCGLLNRHLPEFKCRSDQKTLTRPSVISERFASSSTYQYYHGPLESNTVLEALHRYFCREPSAGRPAESLCRLASAAYIEKSTAYVDIDFDAISHAVVVTLLRNHSAPPSKASTNHHEVSRDPTDGRLEVGVLHAEEAREPEEITLGGLLTVVGEDDRSSQTLFSFPSRHHPLPASHQSTQFTAAFQQPTGLHPKFELTFPRTAVLTPPKPGCALHAYWTLPSTLFLDRYQFSDPLVLASQNLRGLRALSGAQDLEAPDWAVPAWGSAALLELAVPDIHASSHRQGKEWSAVAGVEEGEWKVTIPTHLRYVNGSAAENKAGDGDAARTHVDVHVPWPVVFWACKAEEGLRMPTNPFDRVNLGYDGLFGPKTMFYHVPPAGGEGQLLVETIKVPVIGETGKSYVPVGTGIAVLLGFAWICWQMVAGMRGGTKAGKTGMEKKKQ